MIKTVDLVTWGAAEGAATIIAASLPVLRVFFVTQVQRSRAKYAAGLVSDEKNFLRRLDLFSSAAASNRSRTSTRPDSGAFRPSSRNGWRRAEKDGAWRHPPRSPTARSPSSDGDMQLDDLEMAYQVDKKSPLEPVYENNSREDFDFGLESSEPTSRDTDVDGLRAHPLRSPGAPDPRDFPFPSAHTPRS